MSKQGKNKEFDYTQRGKLPPAAVDVEKAVLGGLLIDVDCIYEVLAVITSGSVFYKEEHNLVFEAIYSLYNQSKKVDILTVIDQLRTTNGLEAVGGEFYIAELSGCVSSTAHIQDHCHIILDKHIQRELISVSNKIMNKAFDGDISGLEQLSEAFTLIQSIEMETQVDKEKTWPDILTGLSKRVEMLSNNKLEYTGIDTGLSEVNKLIGGWQPGKLIILAGRPGMGKTAALVRHVMAALKNKDHVAVFQLEMGEEEMAIRMLCDHNPYFHANMLLKHGFKNDEAWQQLNQSFEEIEGFGVHLKTTPGIDVMSLSIAAKRLKHQHDIKLLVVDYLQLMKGNPAVRYGNREQEVSDISRSLKKLALELDIPILALSQLSREVEKRGDKRPMLSDLRESGSIEQDADIVSFLYRPEYYGFTERDNGLSSEGFCEYIIAKHRQGGLGALEVGFEANRIRFKDYEPPGVDVSGSF